LSFGVFLCPKSRSAMADHTVWPLYPPIVSGHTLHTDQYRFTFTVPHHAPTSVGIGTEEGGPLTNLVANLIDMPDSLSEDSFKIPVVTFFPQHFDFSDAQVGCIGWPVRHVSCDSVLSHCTKWAWEACSNQEVVSPFDSMYVRCDTTFMDTGSVSVSGGALSVFPMLVGEIDGGGSLPKDIADLVYKLEWMFDGDPTPQHSQTADCYGESLVVIADVDCRVDTTSLSD
jgi:hypothetical protein